jgi:hypothetical protein
MFSEQYNRNVKRFFVSVETQFYLQSVYIHSAKRFFVFVETPFYLQSVYIHSANWCEDWVLWPGEGHSLVPFRSY